jgi:hypothetical protein
MKRKLTSAFLVRFPQEQGLLLRKTAADLEMTPAELIRACVSAELARKTGDPAAIEALASMMREGVDEWIRTRVDFEIAKRKKEYEKKRA